MRLFSLFCRHRNTVYIGSTWEAWEESQHFLCDCGNIETDTKAHLLIKEDGANLIPEDRIYKERGWGRRLVP